MNQYPHPYGGGDPEHASQAYEKRAYKNLLWMLKKYGRSIDTIIAFLGGVKQAKLHEMLLFVRE